MNRNLTFNNYNTKLIHKKGIINNNWDFLNHSKKYVIITDSNLYKLYSDLLSNIPNTIDIIIIKAGETSKSFSTYQTIIDRLCAKNVTRNDVIISFGGGVVNDLSLFVAATYQRGLEVISIPTTLLSMVDASIGGKCGINFLQYKNQIGTYYFPKLLIIDESLLETLSRNEFNNGLAEIVKYALLKSEKMFNELSINNYNLTNLIDECIDIKLSVIKNDLYDANNRKLLNFGHTYGHIVESYSNYEIAHGNAVAIGIIKEISNKEIQMKAFHLLSRYFNLNYNIPSDYIKSCILKDKKLLNDTIDVVQIEKIGESKLVSKKVEDLINEYIW